jgi:transposase
MDAARIRKKDNKPVRLFFQDEGRFGRISNIQKCWVPKEEYPVIKKQLVREFIYAYSSICPQTGESFSLILPGSNTQMMNLYLKEFSVHYNNYRIILCLDKAGWHTCSNLEIPQNILLWFLPPYSPELNPVELLWRQIRQDYFNNKLFNSLDQVENALENALFNYYSNLEATKKLANCPWLN